MSAISQASDFLAKVDLSVISPPYLERTFTRLRADMAAHTQDPAFRAWLDNEALPQFLRKVERAYFTLIFQSDLSPESLGLDAEFIAELKRKDQFTRLARLLAQWSVEIELSVDLIERACLYGLYEKPKGLLNINEHIRQNWGIKDASLLKQCVFRVLDFAVYGIGELSDNVIKNTRKQMKIELSNLKVAALGSLIFMFMGAGFPVALMHVIGTSAAVTIGDWISSKAAEHIHVVVDDYVLHSKLQELDSQLEGILNQLTYTNAKAANAIAAESEVAHLEVIGVIEQLLVHRASVDDIRASQQVEALLLENIRMTEQEDYLLIELIDPDLETSVFELKSLN